MEHHSSLKAIQAGVIEGKISLKDLVSKYLDRIEEYKHLNAFIEVFGDEALERAEEIQSKIIDGKAGRLGGLVIGIKDLICYRNHRVSAGSKILEDYVSVFSATVVERLLSEDAIIIGRLNCDEFAMGGSNENSFFGPVRNYADNNRVSGGSSGGSAVAVQAGLCMAALGTDTGGSVRQPASFCGVVGLKPTYGRVSRHGIVAYASSFDQVGPLTTSVEDAALILEVIAGHDEYDSTASTLPVPPYSEQLSFTGKKRIAFLPETLNSEALDPEVKSLMEATIKQLKEEGHTVEPISFPYLDYVVPTYYILTMAESSSNLARYDGVHYGYRSPNATDLETTYKKSRSEGFGAEVKRRIMLGTFVLSAGYYDAYYAKAQRVRRLIREKTDEILKDHDFILLPTSPGPAFGLGEKTDDPVVMYLADIFTVQASLAGIPAISLPLGNNSDGLPLGVQLIGRRFGEAELLAFSKYVSDVTLVS
ncbi:Asp-tRNA(Asn)/Glu-tRNA(Gln) amidotransferase subunit GatA [Pararcticibacter amylolyticus]|uniref:Glutamyl-tRNA(Gln) amidotransferase subunit A n=1 Tax=Pararcticibacter amylolyticus TaxID=2173175 RepID=A0A2U2PIA9_9SPHI|nr:Asp-tRNA(Asn)/Glu-tRNA(Gln) amidotransferase subunit GatA [Pararcticibacter amylolyticus]PWG81004.1 Asp-tRNA(Asn)/Glu-tRNA(Gln) amidotransferase GatCAB subunit A [Pararcticibacter amylolyticus]